MLLQPCMENRKEYKIVVFDGKPMYVSYNPKDSGAKRKAFSKAPHTELLAFAGIAVQRLKQNCPESIIDGLIRVDIFKNKSQQFIVNEFESLDANYYANEGDMIKESNAAEFLILYWMEKIYFCFTCFRKNE